MSLEKDMVKTNSLLSNIPMEWLNVYNFTLFVAFANLYPISIYTTK